MRFLFLPFFLQGGAMLVDEFYFHHKRGLPNWERIGHPLDTLTVLGCLLFLLLVPYTESHLQIYGGLAVFSCLFVTKDEFIHTERCLPFEQWLHSFLFILHPILLATAGWFWINGEEKLLLTGQAILTFCFFLYQIVYWSFYRERSQ